MTATTDLDVILTAWLAEGAEQAPDSETSLALDQIAVTPQARIRQSPGTRDLRLLAIAAMGGLLILLGLGVAYRAGIIGPTTPSPLLVPDPSSSDVPEASDGGELRIFAAGDGSFELRLPDAWRPAQGPDSAALHLQRPGAELSVRAGDAEGSLRMCDQGAGPWETCPSVAATTLDDLAAAIGLAPAAEDGIYPVGPIRTSATLDGERARVVKVEAYESPAAGSEFVAYVVAFHEGRSYVVRIWSSGSSNIDQYVEHVLSGFAFLSPEPPEIEQPEAVGGARTFVGPGGGFQIRMPEAWLASVGEDSSALYLSNGSISITIRTGNGLGEIRTCDRAAGMWETCRSVRATRLATLTASIGLQDEGTVWQGPIESAFTLDDEPATRHWIVAALASPGSLPLAVQYVAAVHDGRPFIVRIAGAPAGTTVGFDSELIAGFSFLTIPSPSQSEVIDGFLTFTAADGSFEVRLSDSWKLDRGPDPSALYLERGAGGASPYRTQVALRWGDAAGRIQTCDEPAGPWEVCRLATATSLEDLATAVAIEPVADHGVGPPVPTTDSTLLDDETAMLIQIQAYEYPARGGQVVAYVIAMHDGRPLIIRFWTNADALEGVDELLAGFRFQD